MGQERNGAWGSIGSVLWGFDILLEKLESVSGKVESELKKAIRGRKQDDAEAEKKTQLGICIDSAWRLLSHYYKLTDKSRAYVVAMVLDPRQKYEYFEARWPEEHIDGMKEKMQSMFVQFERPTSTLSAANSQITTSQSQSLDSDSNDTSDFDIFAWRFGESKIELQTELERYIKAPLLVLPTKEANRKFKPLDYWRTHADEYPTLAAIAAEVYSIPAMSVEPERVFSE